MSILGNNTWSNRKAIEEALTGLTLTPSYSDVGDYYISFSSAITSANAWYSITPYQTLATIGMAVDNNGFQILTAYPDGAGDAVPIDGMLVNRPFEIIIYQ